MSSQLNRKNIFKETKQLIVKEKEDLRKILDFFSNEEYMVDYNKSKNIINMLQNYMKMMKKRREIIDSSIEGISLIYNMSNFTIENTLTNPPDLTGFSSSDFFKEENFIENQTGMVIDFKKN